MSYKCSVVIKRIKPNDSIFFLCVLTHILYNMIQFSILLNQPKMIRKHWFLTILLGEKCA